MMLNKIIEIKKQQEKKKKLMGEGARIKRTQSTINTTSTKDIQQTARTNITNKAQHCCVIRLAIKKNNAFVNITNLIGQTLIKFSIGLIQKKNNTTNKKQLRSLVKWILERATPFAKKNFNCVKIVIKGHKPFAYFKEIKRKKLKIIGFESRIPVIHNGCRPPKKRRI